MTAPPRHETLDVHLARWLVSANGLAAIEEATARLTAGDPADLLTTVTMLRRRGHARDTAAAAVGAARARVRALDRYDDAERLVFTLAGLEQASHPRVAAWRARRFTGDHLTWDLCCGEGGDALALATETGRLVALDRDPARLLLARHNARARGLPTCFTLGDARHPPARHAVLVHVDPGRRGSAGRARRLVDYTPPVPALRNTFARARGAGVVLSPAVDLRDPDIPAGAELEFVQVGSQLVEAVAWTGQLAHAGTAATATILTEDTTNDRCEHVRRREDEVPPLPVRPAGDWLIEPAPAAVRARLHDALGAELSAWRIATRRALLSTDNEPPSSPWWRAWRVEAALPAQPRHLREWLRARAAVATSFSTHGMEVDLDAFWKDSGRPPRGPVGLRIHLVRLDDGARAYVCRSQTRDGSAVPD